MKMILAAIICFTSALANAEGEGPSVGVSVDTSIASTYVFRGLPQYNDKTVPSSQSTVGVVINDLGPGSLSLSLWNATALQDFGQHGGTQIEFDLTLAYEGKVTDDFTLGGGYITYLYPEADQVDAAHEFFVTGSYYTKWTSPFVAIYVEPVRLKGVYFVVGTAHELNLNYFTLNGSVYISLAGYEGGPTHINDVTCSLALHWPLSEILYAELFGSYSLAGHPDAGSFSDRTTMMSSLKFGVEL